VPRRLVHVRQARTVFDPYPRDGLRGVFERGSARIESHDGEVITPRASARAAFFGRSGLRRNIRWDPLDAVYFAGYAMWNYLTFPRLLTPEGVEVTEGEAWPEGGETWRHLELPARHRYTFAPPDLLRRCRWSAATPRLRPRGDRPLGEGCSTLRRPCSGRRAPVLDSPARAPNRSWHSTALRARGM